MLLLIVVPKAVSAALEKSNKFKVMVNEMFNLHKSVEQRSLERQELEANLYSLGWFDGLIGSNPTQPENNSYWLGYSLGCREYWAKKLEVKLPSEI